MSAVEAAFCFLFSVAAESDDFPQPVNTKNIEMTRTAAITFFNLIKFILIDLFFMILNLPLNFISFILFKEIMLSGNGIAYILNSFVFSICSLAVGFLIGTITHNKQAIGGIVNVVALGTSFLCGCFVPMSFMPSYVLKIAHILPTYYFVQNNELIKTLEYFKLETLQPIIINGIIVLGFTLSFVLITLMISKRKQKIG